jgi:adenylate cyclase
MADDRRLTLAVLFADLAGFTALTEAHGDLDAADVATRFSALARAALVGDGRIVKTIGDAVMVVASEPRHAAEAALTLLRAVEREPAFPTVRIGLHAGTVVERDGDVFGTTVNVAARLAAHAHAGELLTTGLVAAGLIDRDDVAVHSLGELTFKNIAEPVEAFSVEDRTRAPNTQVSDPVCRMLVDPNDAPARLPFGERRFYFCSLACAQKFAAQPERYAPND